MALLGVDHFFPFLALPSQSSGSDFDCGTVNCEGTARSQ